MDNKKLYFRLGTIVLLMTFICASFFHILYGYQVLNPIKETDTTDVTMSASLVNVPAARGNITDRYGRVLVGNKTEYVVTLDISAMGDVDAQVDTVLRLLQICKEQSVEWADEELPLSANSPYTFTTETPFAYQDDNGATQQTRLGKLNEKLEWHLNSNSTAQALADRMSIYFGLDDRDLRQSTKRALLGVLYSCYLRDGADDRILWTDYYFAEDVDIDFISVVKEENLKGVSIDATTIRDYQTTAAAHLLGQIGSISAESWQENKDSYVENGYQMSDTIGLSGCESAFESYLKGTAGTMRVVTDTTTNEVVSETYSTEPVAGNNVALTLDLRLQEATEKALSDWTDEINGGIEGSAAVVIDISDGSVLASASYPTFDPAAYLTDYESLSKNERMPLYNRAFLGTYAPGSTYKICTGTAAISSGVIGIGDTIYCSGSMVYGDRTFKCWHAAGHGNDNLADAIRDSCNVYFYTVGSEMGIDYLTSVAQEYGLGEHTGIELTENTGINAGPAFSESLGSIWYPGNTLSASIGQSDNMFTPLQICNYIATFINGGSHYSAHLLKSVKSSDNSKIIAQHEAELLNTIDIDDGTYQAIKKGMGEVIAADNITAFDDLQKNGIKVGCKTGTAQINNNTATNGLFVAFAPYDDPQIAVCVVVEKAEWGAKTADICADIMEYYFSDSATLERVESENTLLR